MSLPLEPRTVHWRKEEEKEENHPGNRLLVHNLRLKVMLGYDSCCNTFGLSFGSLPYCLSNDLLPCFLSLGLYLQKIKSCDESDRVTQQGREESWEREGKVLRDGERIC